MKKISVIFSTALIALVVNLKAQHYRLGGNSTFPPIDDITAPGNNFFGSTAAVPGIPVIMGSAGLERMRMFHRGTPFMLPGPFPGNVPNPYGGNNLTRVGIPVDGSSPLNPLAALHIGYNWPPNLTLFGQQGGFRAWNNVGTLYIEGTDNMYTGLRKKPTTAGDPTGRTCLITGTQSDDQDAVINWGDNNFQVNPPFTPNNLTFIFTGPRLASPTTDKNTEYGLEVARMTPDGLMGIGPVFFDNAQPQNLLHINNRLTNSAYLQISNAGNTGQTATDGFQIGITPGAGFAGGIAELNNFEDRDMRFFTNNTQWMVIKNSQPGNLGRVGIATNAPGNRLEINSQVGDPQPAGLRFKNLTASSIPVPNPGPGMLTVDLNGDVIYTPTVAFGGTGVGNYCINAPNPLSGEFEIPLNTFKYRFVGQSVITPAPGLQQDMVSIGYPCFSPLPVAKFNVLEQQTVATVPDENYAGYFKNANTMNPNNYTVTAGIYGQAKALQAGISSAKSPLNVGGVFEGYGTVADIGVMGRISKSLPTTIQSGPSRFAIGGAFMSDTSITNPILPAINNIGVFARASKSAVSNTGIYTEAQSSSGSDYGVYAIGPPGGGPGPDYAGYFAGDLGYTGAFGFVSDVNLKTNIDTIQNALGKINQLKPKQFDFNIGAYPNMRLSQGLQYGLIAQDVQTVIPAIVTDNVFPAVYDDNGNQLSPAVNYKGLEYTQLIPIMIRAMQEQQKQIHRQDSLIQVLTQNVNGCCNNQNARQTNIYGNGQQAQNQVLNQLSVDLSDKDVIVLNQNVPNPYAENTIITYNVPLQYNFAQMIFKTIDGKIIRTVDLEKKGRGQLNVFASDLSNGLYMYTLVVDGKEIDTKKMIKQN